MESRGEGNLSFKLSLLVVEPLSKDGPKEEWMRMLRRKLEEM